MVVCPVLYIMQNLIISWLINIFRIISEKKSCSALYLLGKLEYLIIYIHTSYVFIHTYIYICTFVP